MGKCKYDYSRSCKNMHASSQRPKMHKSARSRLRHAGRYGDMRTGTQQDLADTVCAPSQAALVYRTVTRKFPVNSNGRMERLFVQLSLFGLLLLTQPLHSSEQHTRANLEFSSNFGYLLKSFLL